METQEMASSNDGNDRERTQSSMQEEPQMNHSLHPALISGDVNAALTMNNEVAKPFWVEKYKREVSKHWNLFYKNHSTHFFKDRHWTDTEFQDLNELVTSKDATKSSTILEVGCGVGNFMFPILEKTTSIKFHCCDFSPIAISHIKSNPLYSTSRVHAFVHDLTSLQPSLRDRLFEAPDDFVNETRFNNNGVDLISCLFVLSAIPPEKFGVALQALADALKPGGSIMFRDYALHDSAQLRFHLRPSSSYSTVPSLLSSTLPLYKRSDGTLTYFFTQLELDTLFCQVGLQGSCDVVERKMSNRKEGWELTRKFVQGRWAKPRA